MKTFKQFVSKFKEKEPPKFEGPRFPSSKEANDWMSAKVAHAVQHDPQNAHHLFSPASDDYLPLSVHAGSSWKKEHQEHYRKIKKQHPELVAKAKEATTGLAGRISMSRVGDGADYHGLMPPKD